VLIEVSSKSGSVSFEANPQEPLLYAALKAGLSFPFECATGTCGTCKARKLTGVVISDWAQASGNAYLNRERDELLMCQTRALSDSSFALKAPVELVNSGSPRPRFGRATIATVAALAPDVAALRLRLDTPLAFEAGQFVVLKVPHVPGYRAYSMANYSLPANALDFVVKCKPDGGLSPWLTSSSARGAKVEWFGPLGKASFRPQEQRTIVCIAGGSGIASMMAILEHGTASRHFDFFDAAIFFGVRTRSDVFFLDRLAAHAEQFPDHLSISVTFSDDAPTSELRRAYPSIAFASGFPHEIAAQALAGRFAGRVAYLAGPPILVDVSIRMLITQARLPARDIRYDKFS
jgi:toluene monooxygenase electron transfer component